MVKKQYKLLLINPVNNRKRVLQQEVLSLYPPIALGILASLTPANWEVEILDELFEPFEYREADLVCFTAFTPTANRAYELAEIYRDNKVPTVLGGIHASMLPDEALQYVDTVVVGEAENIWPQLIRDFESKRMQNIYRGEQPDLNNLPVPRHDLYHPGYVTGSIHTTRGCPMQCDFCSVHVFNGRKYRFKAVEDVVREYISIPQEMVAFVDDNLSGYSRKSEERLYEICKRIIESGVKKKWFCQASMNIGDNQELLNIMAKAGCQMIFLGIESEVVDNLMSIHKNVNYKIGVENYDRIFRNIHNAGMAVLGAFIFGLDGDTAERMRHRTDYILNSGVDAMQVTVLTPLPGTSLFERLKKENRLLYENYPEDWQRYNVTELVYQPDSMEVEEFNEVVVECWDKLYNSKSLTRKFMNTIKATKNPDAGKWAYSANVQYHNIFLEKTRPRLEITELFKA